MIAIMAIDPGGTTGVARGVFDLELGSVAECLAAGVDMESFDVSGDEREQALGLAIEWADWKFSCCVDSGVGVGLGDCWLVIEDWTPRLPLKSGERVVFYPVRIAAMLEGLLGAGVTTGWPMAGGGPVYQMPSSAKSFGTDARLRRWGCWVRGREHQRDAWRHVALRLSVLLG